MTETNGLKEYVQALVDLRLDGLHMAGDMMMFSFGGYELHAQCFVRIREERRVLVTSLDYPCGQEKAGERFPEPHKKRLLGASVTGVTVSGVHDLTITLDNGLFIELFAANSPCPGEDAEEWVFFRHGDPSYPFVTVSSGGVDIAWDWMRKKEGDADNAAGTTGGSF